jgi:GNAT superfamily N-acetyltransferase
MSIIWNFSQKNGIGAVLSIEDVNVGKSKFQNPSFSDMIEFKLDGGYLEIGKVKGAIRYGIITLMVDEDQRGQGIATALLKRALNETKGELSGMASNDIAVSLNYKLGMRAFDDNGKELSLEQTKKQRAENSWESIRMILPESKQGDNYKTFK